MNTPGRLAATNRTWILFHALRPIFETIAMAKVGTSAEECRELGFLRREDGVSMNRDRLVADAKEAALALVRGGYKPPAASWQEGAQTTQIKVLGEQFLATAKMAIHLLVRGGYASEYDAHVARKLANILAGGAAERAANGERAIRAGPGARSVRFALRRKENARAHRAHLEDRQALRN